MKNERQVLVVAVLVAMVIGSPSVLAENQSLGEKQRQPPEWRALRQAITDLAQSFPKEYAAGSDYLKRLDQLETARHNLAATAPQNEPALSEQRAQITRAFESLRREALLANPLLDFDRLLVIKRDGRKLALPQNWESNSSIPLGNYDNEIAVLSSWRGEGPLSTQQSTGSKPVPQVSTLFRPPDGRFVGDMDLHFDADRLLFSMRGANGRFQVFEIQVDGSGLRPLSLIDEPDVDNYDACYLPNGNIIFSSTAPFIGVPCVIGSSHVSHLYLRESRTGQIRRLTFGQDHDWCPTVLNNGRVLYLHWEYSDLPHFVSRILCHMNPDGTTQAEYYGSNSYWPNAMFYARPVPNHPTRFVAIVGGHHDDPRMGELVLFDPAQGRHEADGVIQRIPGHGGKVEPKIKDELIRASWPKFLHPFPLSDKYFIVSAKLDPQSSWGLYLVDIFDNLVHLKSLPGYALLEPIPLRKTPRPPSIPERVQPERADALVILQDVYAGDALKGVPRGTVQQLRLFTYHFSYHGIGGQLHRVGLDGPWDIKRILGTVPVEPDGSAYFRIPANTPIAMQPLDAEGKAIQLMRSWVTAMPGETISCAGCHERQNTTPALQHTLALVRPPSEIKPWHGPPRGFAFKREVQPVLDRYCVGCHDGQPRPGLASLSDFRPLPEVYTDMQDQTYRLGAKFSPSYLALRRFTRSHTMESDMHLLPPYEFHADTCKVVQLLRKGHYGVQLDAEAWDRLITWIDLNTPAHGAWHEIVGPEKVNHQRDRRRAMLKRYAGIDEDPEMTLETPKIAGEPIQPAPISKEPRPVLECAGWPFDPQEARTRQAAVSAPERTVRLSDELSLKLRFIPAGTFVMGDGHGLADEQPSAKVKLERGFWISHCEISNEQYALFDSQHDSFLERANFLQFSPEQRGDLVNQPRQPVCRVSWEQAMAFCQWLSRETGDHFRLPTEAEWEYACRAGSASPMWYGQTDRDFSSLANLADHCLHFGRPSPVVPPWRPAITNVNDQFRVSAPIGSFGPNPWGLYDMHGNVAEWTLTTYRPYPYQPADGRDDPHAAGRKVVRGGSWSDLPQHARSSLRQAYHPWQGVFDVGFRVVSEGPAKVDPARPLTFYSK